MLGSRRPGQIPQPPLIERGKQVSFMQKYGFRALTILFWVLFLSLFRIAGTPFAWVVSARSVYELFSYKIDSGDFLRQLSIYGMIIVFIGLLLVGWARYNQIRFSRRERRMYFLPPVDIVEIADFFELAPPQLERRSGRRLLITHTEQGSVSNIVAVGEYSEPLQEPVPEQKTSYRYRGYLLARDKGLQWVVWRDETELFRDGDFAKCRSYVDSVTGTSCRESD